MKIWEVPEKFKPKNHVVYPPHQTGSQLEDRAEQFLRTMAPRRTVTSRHFLAIRWTAYHIQHGYGKNKRALEELQNYVNTLPRQNKYFTIVQYDDGCMVDFPFDCKVFAAGGKPDDATPIPLVCDPHIIEEENAKDIPVSLIANVNTHEIRKQVAKAMYGKEYCYIGKHASVQFAEKTQRSHFAICPRGYGKTSFRLYEAIQLGTIPVYVSDEFWLPYQNELDWNQFAMFYNPAWGDQNNMESFIHSLYTMIGTERYYEMYQNLKAVQKLFTYDGVFNSIIGWLEHERR